LHTTAGFFERRGLSDGCALQAFWWRLDLH